MLTPGQRYEKHVLLEVPLRRGLDLAVLAGAGRIAAAECAPDRLLNVAALGDGRAILTLRGRLLADLVVRRLLLGRVRSLKPCRRP